MRARAIELGHTYWVRRRLPPVRRVASACAADGHGGPGWPGAVVGLRARVVELVACPGRRQSYAVIERQVWRAVNGHWFTADGSFGRAMIEGRLRYARRQARETIPVRDVLAPVEHSGDQACDRAVAS